MHVRNNHSRHLQLKNSITSLQIYFGLHDNTLLSVNITNKSFSTIMISTSVMFVMYILYDTSWKVFIVALPLKMFKENV